MRFPLLRALSQRRLDLRLNTGGGLVTRIVERPGETLAAGDLVRLVEDLRAVAARVLPDEPLTYGVFSGNPERLSRAVVTVLYERASGRPVAFNALAVMDVALHGSPAEVLHLGLVMVDPGVRSHGFSWVLYGLTCVVLFVRNQMRPLWISNVTQVPAIIGMVSETFSDVFPSPRPQARQSFEHILLARQIMRDHRHVFGVGADAGFDERRSVVTNAYTGGSDSLKKTFESAPKHRNEAYNAFCARELDYGRGDDVLQIGRLDLATTRQFLLKDVPRASLPSLLGTLAFLALQRLFLPVVHWLSADRPWGILRPYPR
jgi:hypothetical protein